MRRNHLLLVNAALASLTFLLSMQGGAAQTSCGSWTVTTVPFDSGWIRAEFEDVSALPNGQAWAVGSATVPSPPFGPEDVTLVMHWDGSSWLQQPTPYTAPFAGGASDALHAVAALAPNDVWAAGERYGDAGGLSVGAWVIVEHFDGHSWKVVPGPPPPGGTGINFSGTRVYDISALSSDDVWFGGMWGEPNAISTVTWRPLAMHWDGSKLTVHDTPVIYAGMEPVHITSLSAIAPNDIWAACRTNTASGAALQNVILHYDGSSWAQVQVPDSTQTHELREIVAIAPNDVWVFGNYKYPTSPFALHYDGNGWTEVPAAPPARTAAALGPNQIYTGDSTITLFDGSTWSTVETLPGVPGPAFRGMAAAGACSMWAVGRSFSAPSGDMAPLAARLDATSGPGPWIDLGQGLAGASGVPALTGAGTLQPSSQGNLNLKGALGGTPTWMVIGATAQSMPFAGGVLVPSPDVVLLWLPTDSKGTWRLPFTWPAGIPGGSSFVLQAWIQDAAAPAGLSASNGLQAKVP